MNRQTMRIILLGCVLLLTCQMVAQSKNSLPAIRQTYDAANFEQTIAACRQWLNQRPITLTPPETAQLHQYMALSFFNLNVPDSAKTHFQTLLSLAPTTTLDPITTSPKIIEFFNTLKKEMQISPPTTGLTRYAFMPDKRPGAAWRSIVFPGWGQYHKGQKGKAWLLGGAFWGSAFATGFSWLREEQARDDYLTSATAADIAANYETYNSWFKRRRSLMVVTTTIWALTFSDALWSNYATPQATLGGNGTLQFGVAVNF